MKLTLLGGGSEVGASSLHVDMNGTKLLIDAGMRMQQDEPMPALGLLEELGGVHGVLITHAHADHIGALPVVRTMFPDVPMYATPPTLDLMRVMMQDSYRLLETRCRQERRLMPYTEQQVQALLATVLAFPASGKLRLGTLQIEAWRAGHILGAVMYGLSGGGEKLLVTGDISFRAGRTIQGVKMPYGFQPDAVVMESTYGNRLHTDRHTEERRLAEAVAEVVAGGGFALIPAFALGRSQEILLLLQDYMEQGLIPSFPIYVDGMVTSICRIYRSYPQYLKGPVAHRIRQHGDAFLSDGRCVAVQDTKHRELLLQGKPGCIVASSGMLVGGASQWYAERLIQDERHAIFITGYQDEESPGRKLLALAEGTDRTLELNGVVYSVRCRVDRFGLSAHADAMEMTRFIEEMKPARTLLVHGDDDARLQLSRRLDPAYGSLLVENGHSYEWNASRDKGGRTRAALRPHTQSGLEEWVGELLLLKQEDGSLLPALCIGIHSKMRTLTCQTFRKKATVKASPADVAESLGRFAGNVEELEAVVPEVSAYARPWLRELRWERAATPTPAFSTLGELCAAIGAETIGHRLAAAYALLALPESHVNRVRQGGREYALYRLDDWAISSLLQLTVPIQGIRMDPATAMNTVREHLADHPRFARCGAEGADGGQPTIVIGFDYPDAVGDEERGGIAEALLAKTGWAVQFAASVRQDQMVQLARSLIGTPLAANPSIHLQTRQLVVDCPEPADWPSIRERFRQTTGYTLVLKHQGSARGVAAAAGTPVVYGSVDSIGGDQPRADAQPMEANQAQQEVKRWAEEVGVTIYKAGLHQTHAGKQMELHFISPQVALRYRAEMAELAGRIGMGVTYARNPKQNEVLAIVMERIPVAWGVSKTPSLRADRGQVGVKAASASSIDPEALADVVREVERLTGYKLVVE